MSRPITIAALMALAAVSVVEATTDSKSLFNPTLLTLEEAMKHAVETVKPPEPPEMDLWYKVVIENHIKDYQEAESMHRKIWYLSLSHLKDVRALVVKNVLENVESKLEAASQEVAKWILQGACAELARGLRPALLVTGRERHMFKDYISNDKVLLRLFDLNDFCKFL